MVVLNIESHVIAQLAATLVGPLPTVGQHPYSEEYMHGRIREAVRVAYVILREVERGYGRQQS